MKKKRKIKSYSFGGRWKDNQMNVAFNKFFNMPKDYQGPIEGFKNAVPDALKVFGGKIIEE